MTSTMSMKKALVNNIVETVSYAPTAVANTLNSAKENMYSFKESITSSKETVFAAVCNVGTVFETAGAAGIIGSIAQASAFGVVASAVVGAAGVLADMIYFNNVLLDQGTFGRYDVRKYLDCSGETHYQTKHSGTDYIYGDGTESLLADHFIIN